jgi:hypothetical protein
VKSILAFLLFTISATAQFLLLLLMLLNMLLEWEFLLAQQLLMSLLVETYAELLSAKTGTYSYTSVAIVPSLS